MLSSLFFLIFGSLGLYFGSEFLIDGAKSLAKKLKVSDLVIGLTIVSVGTSFPELIVGLISAFQGYTEFVIGNVFCLLYTSPSPRDTEVSRMPSSA